MKTKRESSAVRVMLAALLLLVCGYSLCNNTIAVTMNPIIETFALTGSSQGLMTSMMNFGAILPLFIIPLLQGRVKKIWLILVSALVLLASMALTGASEGFAFLIAVCVLLGAGHNFLDTMINSYMVDLYPGDSTRCLGLLHGFYGIGGLLTPLLISYILTKSTWRVSYFIGAAIFAVIVTVFAFMSLPRYKTVGTASAAKEEKLTAAMFKRYIGGKRNLLLLAAAALYGVSQTGLINWVVRYTAVRFDNAEMGSLCVSAYWICCAFCRLFSPNLKIQPSVLLVAGAALGGVFHAAGVLSGSAAFMVVASGLVGLVSGVCLPVILSEAAIGNEDMTSLTTSGIFLIMGVSRMLMPLLMGAVAESSIVVSMLLPALTSLLTALVAAAAARCRS